MVNLGISSKNLESTAAKKNNNNRKSDVEMASKEELNRIESVENQTNLKIIQEVSEIDLDPSMMPPSKENSEVELRNIDLGMTEEDKLHWRKKCTKKIVVIASLALLFIIVTAIFTAELADTFQSKGAKPKRTEIELCDGQNKVYNYHTKKCVDIFQILERPDVYNFSKQILDKSSQTELAGMLSKKLHCNSIRNIRTPFSEGQVQHKNLYLLEF